MATIPKYGILLFLSLFSYFLIPVNFFILFIGSLSILIGSLGLSNQWRIKRFLAYSAITNIGFLLLALGTNQLDYYIYYLIIYALTSIGIFLILLSLENNPEMILQLSGLYHKNPYLGLSFTFFLFSLMGLPPMAGFFAKLMILASIINLDLISLALIAVIGSIIGAINYLNLIKIINVNLPHESYSSSSPFFIKNTFGISYDLSYSISLIVIFTILFLFYPLNLLSLSNFLLFINV